MLMPGVNAHIDSFWWLKQAGQKLQVVAVAGESYHAKSDLKMNGVHTWHCFP